MDGMTETGGTIGDTDTLTRESTSTDTSARLSNSDGNHERFAHYVKKDKIVESAVLGSPVVALCGKVWVPSRDPQKFPVCPECLKIHASMRGGDEPSE